MRRPFRWDKKYLYWGITAFCVVAAAILFYMALNYIGAVGREMLKILEEYDIPVAKLLPLASARSAGGYVKFHGEDVLIEEATDESFAGMDYVLGAAENGMSRR